MGMRKPGSTAVAPTPAATTAAAPAASPAAVKTAAPVNADSGTAAAINRLKKKTEDTAAAPAAAAKSYAGRDYAEEARGKTRCVQFEAALMSPAIAGMKFDTMEEYLKLVQQAADAGVAYTFGE